MFKNNLAQGTIHAKHEKLYRQRKDKSAFQHQMSKVRPPCKGNHPEVVAPSQHTGQPVLFQQTLFFPTISDSEASSRNQLQFCPHGTITLSVETL